MIERSRYKPRLGPSREWWLWLGPALKKAKAGSGQAKATAFGPSQARQITSFQAKKASIKLFVEPAN